MKLVRFGTMGNERPGIVDNAGAVRDASAVVEDWCGAALGDAMLAQVAAMADELPVVEGNVRLGAPVSGIGKLIVIGLNYRAHAAEAKMAPPTDPIIVLVAPTAVCGCSDDIVLPADSEKADWEIELGVVIGREGFQLSESEALDYVAGYCIANDISERTYQLERGNQWGKGKSYDTFKPLGPWLVTRDAIPNPQNLNMTLQLNGEVCQQDSSSDMIFSVAQLISRTSHYMRLCPGDTFVTGTPPGVGFGMKPPRYLRDGDVLHLSIDGLGEQRNTVRRG